ncbi:MAG: ABC transporter substrate-binding protein [Lachnospiraceae bacterium]|nr:ABC transporter substrate-binding protein [Lachnospiraceae bacterium]
MLNLKLRKIVTGILIGTMVFALAGCGNSAKDSKNETTKDDTATEETAKADEELEKISFVLDWTPNTNHTGLYVAQKMGYFKEAGLSVEIVQPPEDGAEMLVASGDAQFGVSFQDSMVPSLIGDDKLPITAVAAVLQHNTSGIISRKGEGMDKPKGLEGKKYATWDLPIEKATIQSVMEAEGGDFSKVELIPSTVTDEVSALKSKNVDAIWVFYGWAGIATKVAGLETDYFAFKDIDPVFDYYTPVIIGNNDYLANNADKAKAFLSAVAKGYEYAIENPEEAADILLEYAPELDKELVVESQKYMAEQYKAEVEQWGYIDPTRWNGFYNWLNENKLVDEEIPENTGFSNDYLEAAK